jgi:hypothetical protein
MPTDSKDIHLMALKSSISKITDAIAKNEHALTGYRMEREELNNMITSREIVLNNYRDRVQLLRTALSDAEASLPEPLSEPLSEPSVKPQTNAHLINQFPRWLIETNWPYMRVKNMIKRLGFGTTRISHYDGLKLLADKKRIHINELVKMDYTSYYKTMSGGDSWTHNKYL